MYNPEALRQKQKLQREAIQRRLNTKKQTLKDQQKTLDDLTKKRKQEVVGNGS